MNSITTVNTSDNRKERPQAGGAVQDSVSFKIGFEDRKYTVVDKKVAAGYQMDHRDYTPREDIYSVDDKISLMRADDSIRVLKKGYFRLHPFRVISALFASPVLTVVSAFLKFLGSIPACIACSLASAFVYFANGAYAASWMRMDKNCISVPLAFLVFPLIFKPLGRVWGNLMTHFSFPALINNATRDKVLKVQEERAASLRERIRLGEANDGKFVAMPDTDYYELGVDGGTAWLTALTGYAGLGSGITNRKWAAAEGALDNLASPPVTGFVDLRAVMHDAGVHLSDNKGAYYYVPSANGGFCRSLFSAKAPGADISSLSFLTDEDVARQAGGDNFIALQKAAISNTVRRLSGYEADARKAGDDAVAAAVGSVDEMMGSIHSGKRSVEDIAAGRPDPGIAAAAAYVYSGVMEGCVDKKIEAVRRERSGLRYLSTKEALKMLRKGIRVAKQAAREEFLADYEKFAEVIEARKKDGVPSGTADTGARIAESAMVVNFIARAEKALGHRGLLQAAGADNGRAYARTRDLKFIPRVKGSHFWGGKYHTVTDLQMEATAKGMRTLKKTGLSPAEIAMDSKRFAEYVTSKFRTEFERAQGVPALRKTIYRNLSRRYHPDAAPTQFKERFDEAFRILTEIYNSQR